jgi:Na+-translocating ferredoxin:NAD+ oxidoreductase RnfG subunit
MANFDNSAAKRNSTRDANNLLALFQNIYTNGKAIQTLMALYQANTDPTFNGAVNALFTQSERQELLTMQNQVNALITDWTANHAGALGG